MYPIIEARLEELSLSRRRLAKELNMDYRALAYKLDGQQSFTLDEVIALRKLIGIKSSIEECFIKR